MTPVTKSRWWEKRPEGQWLKRRGWTVVSASTAGYTPKGSAVARSSTKQIIFQDKKFYNSSVRDRDYVMLHEMAHAIHFEVLHYISKPLVQNRGLDYDDAIECVGDAYCYRRNLVSSMRGWVEFSVRWHKLNTTAHYRMADVRSKEAKEIVDQMKNAVLKTVL